jgi:hypothetical protein
MSRDALREEHESLQRATQDARRHSLAGGVTAFVRAMQKVMDDYRDARAAGMSRADAVKGIAAELRSVWPHHPTKFGPQCDACEDTGWREMSCWSEQRCGREMCAKAHPGHEHLYVVPCDCPKGDPKGKGRQRQMDDISEAMKVRKPKPRGFARV